MLRLSTMPPFQCCRLSSAASLYDPSVLVSRSFSHYCWHNAIPVAATSNTAAIATAAFSSSSNSIRSTYRFRTDGRGGVSGSNSSSSERQHTYAYIPPSVGPLPSSVELRSKKVVGSSEADETHEAHSENMTTELQDSNLYRLDQIWGEMVRECSAPHQWVSSSASSSSSPIGGPELATMNHHHRHSGSGHGQQHHADPAASIVEEEENRRIKELLKTVPKHIDMLRVEVADSMKRSKYLSRRRHVMQRLYTKRVKKVSSASSSSVVGDNSQSHQQQQRRQQEQQQLQLQRTAEWAKMFRYDCGPDLSP